jgi:hypothetical protein
MMRSVMTTLVHDLLYTYYCSSAFSNYECAKPKLGKAGFLFGEFWGIMNSVQRDVEAHTPLLLAGVGQGGLSTHVTVIFITVSGTLSSQTV